MAKRKRMVDRYASCEWLPLLEVYRCGRLILHDCKALSDFSSECLGFQIKNGRLLIYGCDLKLADYCEETAVVTGRIEKIEWFGAKLPSGGI